MALRDAVGTVHTPALGAVRIVSLVPSVTELACELGLADRLVGRTGFCIHPRDKVKRIPKLGGTKDVNIPRLRALTPTHVIVNIDENRKETVDQIAHFVPHIIVTHPLTPLDNPALYRLIGGVFGKVREAEALCDRFEQAYAEARNAALRFDSQRVLYLIWRDPWMTVSRDTYVARTLAVVNWITIPESASERYPRITLDESLLAHTDAVLLSTEPYMFRDHHLTEMRTMPQLRGKAIALIDGEMTSWYGSRAINALDYLVWFRRAVAVRQA